MNPQQLKARFPYMFGGQNIGLSFHRGWFPLFEQLCEDIDELLGADKRGFHWTQLKEKFGSARYYWQMDAHEPDLYIDLIGADQVITVTRRAKDEASSDENDDSPPSLPLRIAELVRQATLATGSLCIVCGQPATLNRDQPWVLVLCERHASQRRRGKLEPHWFDEDEL